MALWQESSEMCVHVFLLFSGIQLATGCSYGVSHHISCSTGESVLLSCADIHSQYKDIQWWYLSSEVNNPEYQLSPAHCSKGRCNTNRFHVHRNLSMSITDLTIEDTGKYWCRITKADSNKYIALSIEGCSISVNETSAVKISRYSGESVLFSCFVLCSARHKLDRWGWKLPNGREMTSTELNNLHEDRVQMFNITSGNYSLLISNLTEEDEGLYSCWINKNQQKYFSLAVKSCVVSASNETMMSHPGQSVLLSCTCEDDQTKAKHFEWRRADLNRRIVSETERSTGRFETLGHDSPANLSLLISDLTEADQGSYVCTVNGKQSRVINLTVTGSESLLMSILITGLMMLLVLGSALCIYRRCVTAKKNSSRTSQREDHENGVTYAAVKLNMRPKLQEELTTKSGVEVIYSSVVHSKPHRPNALHADKSPALD